MLSKKDKSKKEPITNCLPNSCLEWGDTGFTGDHKWGKWMEFSRGDRGRTNLYTGAFYREGIFVLQERKCSVCGEIEMQKITV
jgi:hypothetical protein